jgi:hypothetical protein
MVVNAIDNLKGEGFSEIIDIDENGAYLSGYTSKYKVGEIDAKTVESFMVDDNDDTNLKTIYSDKEDGERVKIMDIYSEKDKDGVDLGTGTKVSSLRVTSYDPKYDPAKNVSTIITENTFTVEDSGERRVCGRVVTHLFRDDEQLEDYLNEDQIEDLPDNASVFGYEEHDYEEYITDDGGDEIGLRIMRINIVLVSDENGNTTTIEVGEPEELYKQMA